MNNYCCQIMSKSGRILETFHKDFLEASKKATEAMEERYAKQAQVFHYPDMDDPIFVARTIL